MAEMKLRLKIVYLEKIIFVQLATLCIMLQMTFFQLATECSVL